MATEVSDFLLISATNADAASYTTSLTQTREGKLRPVSSKDGVSFFYTGSSNVGADGTARSASYTAYSEAETQSGDPTPTVDNALTNANAGKAHTISRTLGSKMICAAPSRGSSSILFNWCVSNTSSSILWSEKKA